MRPPDLDLAQAILGHTAERLEVGQRDDRVVAVMRVNRDRLLVAEVVRPVRRVENSDIVPGEAVAIKGTPVHAHPEVHSGVGTDGQVRVEECVGVTVDRDPWLAVDGDTDTFFYANLAVRADTGVDLGVSVHRGSFDGNSFAWNDVRVFNSPNGANDFCDKEAIAIDPHDGNNAVVSLTNFQALCGVAQNGLGQIEVWRTHDGGDTWLGPAIAGPERPDSVANCGNAGTLQQSSVPVFGLDGDVFVTWQVGPTFSAAGVPSKNAAIFVAHSLDGGATFGAPVKVADINSMRQDAPVGYNRGRINDHPRIAVPSQGEAEGRVLVVFPSAKVPTSAPSTAQNLVSINVFLSFSDDGGATWSSPKSIAGSVPATGVKRFWPVVTAGSEGSVDVVYYESLEQAAPDGSNCNVGLGGVLRRIGPAHRSEEHTS